MLCQSKHFGHMIKCFLVFTNVIKYFNYFQLSVQTYKVCALADLIIMLYWTTGHSEDLCSSSALRVS